MCRTEALQLQLSKTNKKQRGGHLFNGRVITDRAPSYNGAKTATRKHSFKSTAINGRPKERKKKRTCRRANGEERKKY